MCVRVCSCVWFMCLHLNFLPTVFFFSRVGALKHDCVIINSTAPSARKHSTHTHNKKINSCNTAGTPRTTDANTDDTQCPAAGLDFRFLCGIKIVCCVENKSYMHYFLAYCRGPQFNLTRPLWLQCRGHKTIISLFFILSFECLWLCI